MQDYHEFLAEVLIPEADLQKRIAELIGKSHITGCIELNNNARRHVHDLLDDWSIV